jgi:ribosomal protein L25 (general stress protein Ctc)
MYVHVCELFERRATKKKQNEKRMCQMKGKVIAICYSHNIYSLKEVENLMKWIFNNRVKKGIHP